MDEQQSAEVNNSAESQNILSNEMSERKQTRDDIYIENNVSENKERPEEEILIFEDFSQMDYALFVNSEVAFNASYDYDRYGIYGNFTKTVSEGEAIYFDLVEEVLGANFDKELPFIEPSEWFFNKAPLIHDVSSDLTYMTVRQYVNPTAYKYISQLFHNGELIKEEQGSSSLSYILCSDKDIERLTDIQVNLVENAWQSPLHSREIIEYSCFNENGNLAAIVTPYNSIQIYETDTLSLKYDIRLTGIKAEYPIQISQIEGDDFSGWFVFANGGATYRMSYPERNVEKIGEFMFDAKYSPDQKYLAYCTGSILLSELWMDYDTEEDNTIREEIDALYEKWYTIPQGWYIKELDTEQITYIPVEKASDFSYTLYSGHCVWIDKNKLFELIGYK